MIWHKNVFLFPPQFDAEAGVRASLRKRRVLSILTSEPRAPSSHPTHRSWCSRTGPLRKKKKKKLPAFPFLYPLKTTEHAPPPPAPLTERLQCSASGGENILMWFISTELLNTNVLHDGRPGGGHLTSDIVSSTSCPAGGEWAARGGEEPRRTLLPPSCTNLTGRRGVNNNNARGGLRILPST